MSKIVRIEGVSYPLQCGNLEPQMPIGVQENMWWFRKCGALLSNNHTGCDPYMDISRPKESWVELVKYRLKSNYTYR